MRPWGLSAGRVVEVDELEPIEGEPPLTANATPAPANPKKALNPTVTAILEGCITGSSLLPHS